MSFLKRNTRLLVLAVGICGMLPLLCEAIDLPPGVKQCHGGDVSCIKDAMHYIMKNYPDGYPGIGLNSIREVNITDVVISKALPDTPVQLNLKFDFLTINGLENMTVQRLVGYGSDLSTTKFEFYSIVPRIVMRGVYAIDGKVLLLPLTGNGIGHIELGNVQLSVKLKGKDSAASRNGKVFLKLQKVKALMVPERLHVNFENLLNGNVELGQTMNKLINDNWKDIWQELESGINNAMADSVKKIISSVTDTLPYSDFYINSDNE